MILNRIFSLEIALEQEFKKILGGHTLSVRKTPQNAYACAQEDIKKSFKTTICREKSVRIPVKGKRVENMKKLVNAG